MATLEKIRSKSVFLIVTIGVALFAFIIGDFLTSGRSIIGNDRVVATVGGDKIDIIDFQKRYNEATQQMQGRNNDLDQAVLQQQVLDAMVQEKLITDELNKLGIEVSADELTEFMVGKNASYQLLQFAQQMGASSPAELYSMTKNPSNYGLTNEQVAPLKQQLLQIENQTEQMLKYAKFERLVSGAIQANDLDKKALNNDNAIYNITFAKKALSDINDEEYPVSAADLKAEYNKNKERYRLNTEVRKGNVILVNIVPSETDEQEGQKIFEDAVVELRNNEGVAGVFSNDLLTVKQSNTTLARTTNSTLKEFLSSASVNDLSEVSHVGETYSVTKLVGKKVETDSVMVNIVLAQGDAALQDSVLAQLQSGIDLSAFDNSENVQVAQQDQWINLMDLSASEADAKNKILEAGKDYFVLNSSDQGAVFCKVIDKKAPKTQYEIAEVSYTVEPSETTKQNLRDKLQSYIIDNNTKDDFVNNALQSGYQAMEVQLTNDMPQINNVKDTRKVLQWAFNAKKNEVSPIFEADDNYYVAIALADIIDGGYAPLSESSISMMLTDQVRSDKKAAKIIGDVAGKATDLAGYAALLDSKIDTTTVNLNTPFISLIGFDPILAGAVAGTTEGTVGGPVKGMNGVYVFTVNSVDAVGTTLSDAEAAARYSQRFGGAAITGAGRQNQAPLLIDILREKQPVKNQMLRFY